MSNARTSLNAVYTGACDAILLRHVIFADEQWNFSQAQLVRRRYSTELRVYRGIALYRTSGGA